MAKIAWLGLGAMGSRIAENFLAGGHELTVYNRSAAKTAQLAARGARAADTPAAAAAEAEIIFAMLSDDEASKAVWLGPDGALAALRRGAIAVDSTTATPGWMRTLADHVHERGAAFLDAPVLGTRPQAEGRKLISLISGDEAAFATVQPIYSLSAAVVHYLGATGNAACMKLAINAQYAVQVAIWAETLALLERNGISNAQAVEVINTAQSTSPTLQTIGKQMVARDFAPLFPIELVEKDLRYAQTLATQNGLNTPLLTVAMTQFQAAVQAGLGDRNIAGIAELFRQHGTAG